MQSVIVVLAVVLAVVYLGARAWRAAAAARRAKNEPGCGSSCGCGTSPVQPKRPASR